MSITTTIADWLTRRVQAQPPLSSQHELNMVLRQLAKWRSQMLANTFVRHHGRVVLQGPFAGMNYAANASEGAWMARLLGSYESELHPYVEALVAAGLDCVIDVGCAEGFYAVGLARLMPQATVYAYDISPAARQACATMAEANAVADRVVVREEFRPEDLAEFAGRRCLVFIDAEGAEDDLLDPARGAALAQMHIIAETHPGARPGVTERLIQRFAATHEIQRIDQQGKAWPLPPWLQGLGHLDQLLAVWEWRAGPTPWLVMRPKD